MKNSNTNIVGETFSQDFKKVIIALKTIAREEKLLEEKRGKLCASGMISIAATGPAKYRDEVNARFGAIRIQAPLTNKKVSKKLSAQLIRWWDESEPERI